MASVTALGFRATFNQWFLRKGAVAFRERKHTLLDLWPDVNVNLV